MQAQSRFFEVERKLEGTSQGKVELPVLYFDVSNVMVFFSVDADAARARLEGTRLTPVLLPTGRALGGLSFYEYRRTTIGPYNEVGTGLLVLPPGVEAGPMRLLELFRSSARRALGFWIVDLPVTTELANAGGRELWGYPKFVTEIPFSLARRRLESRVLDPADGSDIVRLHGRMLPGLPVPGMDLVLYSRHGDRLLRTVVDVNATMRLAAGVGLRVELGLGAHPMAMNLRELGLRGRPLMVLYTDRFRSRLNAGVEIARLG